MSLGRLGCPCGTADAILPFAPLHEPLCTTAGAPLHLDAVLTCDPGSRSVMQALWADVEAKFKETALSFELIPETRDYVAPDRDPWRFF